MNQIARIQLFLLHFAGGSRYGFDFLKSYISRDFEFIPLELPGRGARFNEPLLSTKSEVVEDYLKQIRRLRNRKPYLIYGHSMGGMLGLSVVKGMELVQDPPLALIVTGNAGPGVRHFTPEASEAEPRKRYLMNDDDFKKELRVLGGIPEEILQNDELYNLFSPIIRADFSISEKYNSYEMGMSVATPIFAIMGDEEDTADRITNWANFTTAEFKYQTMPGNHFFIHDHPEQLANIIMGCSTSLSVTAYRD